ncbi:tRNA pseudouridine synthase-like 1 [Sitodiplosis mosellana]|uniref:tRNA pseudouridine synthase-like 1 n=1 Tax=Sitodiplosis mosellana TaxID=263140 RepID=UPI002443C0A8|nr:tRNA pseudouridine synthase-like 1 [Sitodiplosis mosellana]
MVRYLLNVSYIGTAFRGVTFIQPYYRYRDLRTIQGVLENAVKCFFKKRCTVCCSSRTDARVHALSSTFHIDVDREQLYGEEEKYEIIAALNDNLKWQKAAVRINAINLVDENSFEAYRNVENRTYLYRLAVQWRGKPKEPPIEEIDRCFVVEDCDMNKFKIVAEMFVGKHDFRSFMQYSKEEKTKEACYSQRKIQSIKIEQSMPCVISSTCDNYFQFYDITFTANSYVYRQIRRIVGALCALAQGRITERDIYELLTIPSFHTWDHLFRQKQIETAPAYGLYFIGINYKPEEDWTLEPIELSARGTRIKSFFDGDKQEKHGHQSEAHGAT